MKRLALGILSLLIIKYGPAQTGLHNTGTLYVSTNSDVLYVTGSFTNTSTGSLTNNGTLYVGQTLTNDQASMAVGTGTLNLVGSASQSIAGAQVFNTFNLVTNNAAGIALNNNISVSGTHTFTAGIITSSATPNYLIYQAGSSYTGDGDNQHVNGWVRKFGNTAFSFPVGNGTVERKVGLTGLTASSQFDVKYAITTPNYTNIQPPIISDDRYEYWTINKISGGNASVVLNWDNSKITFPQYILADIRATRYNGTLWTNAGGIASGSVATTGTITSTVMTTFGMFGLGSVSAALPLEFVSISASSKKNYNLIEWRTTDEINVDHFEIERKNEGGIFTSIGQQPATNGPGIASYSFRDVNLIQGSTWYRVRSVDKDGTFGFSKVVLVNNQTMTGGDFVLTNPSHAQITITAPKNADGAFNYNVISTNGQLIAKGNLQMHPNSSSKISLPAGIAPGIYVVELSNSVIEVNKKMILK